MRTLFIVVPAPSLHLLPRLFKAHEPVSVARSGLRARARRPSVRDHRRRGGAGSHRLGGWLASPLVRPATLLALLGVGMALAAAMQSSWPTWLAAVVASLFSATAVSWHGVLLAEVARLSPPSRIGSTTGAVLAFGDAGAFVLPLLFSAAPAVTEGYGHWRWASGCSV
jgi:nitrate/nitrite transporter NarK